ncbi:class I tRNA ligase family protein, partial [Patescibacteria group bacterium]|nr:class I tRNA ligase family protein [Patescibacteria group bacterium]
MSTLQDMPKAYNASSVEGGIYASWEKSGAFKPHGDGEPYCIVMPPPNRTGVLHLGHAVMLAIEDLLIRYHRMLGKRTLWIPGTDHAAIATQVKVEQELIKKGIKNPREELGREKLLQEVVKFADESATTIRSQVRKMGSSCDWSREKYTLDEERTRAVNEMFKMMYEDGIIEQGHRLVNWDPQFQTTLSDDEVEHKETMAKFLTFKYDSSFPIAISTTRPETKFGDTAVAVNPDDKRYQKFVGKTFEPIFCGKRLSIKVIADKAVDPDFGTGALGVTPAHSMVDAEMAERHGLPMVCVIGTDARMTEDAGEDFAGLAIEGARKKIYARLQEEGLIEKEEEIPQNLPIAQRGGAPVEQLPMKQWFVRVNKPFKLRQTTLGKWKKGDKTTLKELMRHAVEARQIKIVPDRFEKIYFHWIDNLHDWCISRQIW